MISRLRAGLLALFISFACLHTVLAQEDEDDDGTRYITYQSSNGETLYLADDRKPSLYTENFGDCLGSSTINLTRFDAAYYQDNMTVLFHLAGDSGIANDSLMMYIGVFAYGEDRFDLIFNPCDANIYSLCPINSSVPITASGIIPVAESDVANIPSIALSIPDFEGEAILRIFSNTTQEEIACYSGVVTNGASFSQPAGVGTVLGIFTFVALLASFATAIYGEAVPTMRLHYAHSLSVGVVFAVWQHIFFSGALSVNWPSVLVAWWSNFAWAGGMIYTSSMQGSINNFIGNNIGNTAEVGAAQSGSDNSDIGGGYDISQIYKRAFSSGIKRAAHRPLLRDIASEIYGRDPSNVLRRDLVQRSFERTLARRAEGGDALEGASDGYRWYGQRVGPGMPLPGNYSGFAGTLAEEGIRVSNAFMTGFLWFLIALVALVGSVVIFKWLLEGLARVKLVKQDRLKFFRDHWLGYTAVSALRICFIGWFMIMFLTIFQFTFGSSGGVKAVAGIVFIIFFLGMPAIAAYAFWYKRAITDTANHLGEHNTLLGGKLPIPSFGKKAPQTTVQDSEAQHDRMESKNSAKPLWKRMKSSDGISEGNHQSIHDDEDYTMKFGWLAARFRRTRWWFFTFWLFYEFLRAIFYGGASGYAKAQVFGLLVVEVLAFAYIIWMRPFEGQRLNIIVVYCLGFSKIATVALSAAFDVEFNLARILTTVIGIVIIVIQGILTIITMVAIIVGTVSSYMSISRNRAAFRPRRWYGIREKYFDHLDRTVNDVPREPKPKKLSKKQLKALQPEEPPQGFEMKTVRRMKKIEDEDTAFASEMRTTSDAAYAGAHEVQPANSRSGAGSPTNRSRTNSRAPSVYSTKSTTHLPYGARPHRPSWSTRDFTAVDTFAPEQANTPIDMTEPVDDAPPVPPIPAKRARTPSRGTSMPTKLQMKLSADTLNIGGDVSTFDTIGYVPAPTMRPRSGTNSSLYGSLRAARNSGYLEDETSDSQPPSQRTSVNYGQAGPSSGYGRGIPLTPAEERDEFFSARTSPRQQ